jgi:hypothetical protein
MTHIVTVHLPTDSSRNHHQGAPRQPTEGSIMERRKPTPLEQVQLTRNAVAHLRKFADKGDRLTSMRDAAYRSLEHVEWLDDKSIAAMASSCRRMGLEPYAKLTSSKDWAAAAVHGSR